MIDTVLNSSIHIGVVCKHVNRIDEATSGKSYEAGTSICNDESSDNACVNSQLYMLLIRGQVNKKTKEDFWLFKLPKFAEHSMASESHHDSIRQQVNKQKTIISTIRQN